MRSLYCTPDTPACHIEVSANTSETATLSLVPKIIAAIITSRCMVVVEMGGMMINPR